MPKNRNNNYGYNPQQDDSEKQQSQELLTLSAYDRKIIHKLFRNTLEWTEKYIEVVHSEDYPNWQTRKKIRDNNIKRQDANDPKKIDGLFSAILFGFKIMSEDKPEFLLDELKKEYYEWLGAVEINPNNCPQKLKHFLFEINEILERRGEKIESDIRNKKREIEPNSPEYGEALNKIFSSTMIPMENARNESKSLGNKIHTDIKVGNNFGGNSEQAEQVFKQMATSHDYKGFDFVPQKNQQIQNPNYNPLVDDPSEEFLTSNSPAMSSNQQIDEFQQARRFLIDDIKQHANEFELKPVLTFNGHRYDAINKKWTRYGKEKQETMLVHESAQITENDYNEFGYLPIQNDKMFQENRFSQAEWVEIQESLKNSQKEQVSRQSQNQSDNNRKGGNKGPFGGYGSSILFGSFSVISLIGLAFTKK